MSEKYLYTIQLSKRRLLSESDITLVDTSVKTGLLAFAPSWNMVWGIKNGQLSEALYREQFISILRRTWHTYHKDWRRIIEMPKIALGCYCKPNVFCHRHIVKEALTRVHEQRKNVVIDGGEITM